MSCKPLSATGSRPTTLEQGWSAEGVGHIWEVGDRRASVRSPLLESRYRICAGVVQRMYDDDKRPVG